MNSSNFKLKFSGILTTVARIYIKINNEHVQDDKSHKHKSFHPKDLRIFSNFSFISILLIDFIQLTTTICRRGHRLQYFE